MGKEHEKVRGFTFLVSFDESFEAIRDNDTLRLKFFDALRDYWFRGIKPSFTGSDAFAWRQIEHQLIRSREAQEKRAQYMRGNQNAAKDPETEKTDDGSGEGAETEKTDGDRENRENQKKQYSREEKSGDEKSGDELSGEDNSTLTLTPKPPSPESPPKPRPPTKHGKALEFWKTVNRSYPAHRRVYDPPARILRKIEEKRLWERTDEILSALESWKSSKSWREDSGKFIPSIRRFVEEGVYEAPPEEPTAPKSAYDTTQARGDALERSLAESKKNRPEIQII